METKITTTGELMISDNKIYGTSVNFRGSKDDLIDYLNHRVEAMTKHIEFLEEECDALYGQIPNT